MGPFMTEIHVGMEWIANIIEITAVAIMAWAFLASLYGLVSGWVRGTANPIRNMQVARYELGMKLVFALELLIVSDLIHTVVSHSIEDLVFLGVLVAIRTITAYFLHKEIKDMESELAGQP